LNKAAAIAALPKVVSIMGAELGWGKAKMQKEFEESLAYIEYSFAGPESNPVKS
jgi:hypothetical protein